jgi:hypothetical protein
VYTVTSSGSDVKVTLKGKLESGRGVVSALAFAPNGTLAAGDVSFLIRLAVLLSMTYPRWRSVVLIFSWSTDTKTTPGKHHTLDIPHRPNQLSQLDTR